MCGLSNTFFCFLVLATSASALLKQAIEVARKEERECFLRYSNHSLPPPSSLKKVNLIYLRRARKAGSTTVFNDLVRFRSQYFSVAGNDTAWKIQGMEYEAMNVECVLRQGAMLARSNGVIKIAHFREPLSRINSEFWFKGPGHAFNSGNESLWKAWLAESSYLEGGGIPKFHGVQGAKFNEGIYFSNYYTRLYSKSCGDCAHANDKRGWKGYKGCAAHTKLYPYLPLETVDLERAKLVLSGFEIVLIMEWFSRPVQKTYFKRKLESLLEIPPHTDLFESFDAYRPLGVERVTSTGRVRRLFLFF